MSSASCSIETPALTWRTFRSLSLSLLKGISREKLSVIFWGVDVISVLRDGPAGSLSLGFLTRHKARRSPLTLLDRAFRPPRSSCGLRHIGFGRYGDCARAEGKQVFGGSGGGARRAHNGTVVLAQDL
jgi:hypothetical protein